MVAGFIVAILVVLFWLPPLPSLPRFNGYPCFREHGSETKHSSIRKPRLEAHIMSVPCTSDIDGPMLH